MLELYSNCDGRAINKHNDPTVASAVMKERMPDPPSCDRSVWKLMQACWAEPGKRPQFDAIAEQLSRTLVGGVDPTHLVGKSNEDRNSSKGTGKESTIDDCNIDVDV